MKAEIIAVGTEILLGQITNTNASVVARALATLGIDSLHQQVVGDNPERLTAAIDLAAHRADLVVLIGGLGPTKDDLTKQTLAAYLHVPLVVNFPAHENLRRYAKQSGHAMTPNNWVQAQLPFGAQPLTNHVGLAVGAIASRGGQHFVLLPGPPREFEPMVRDELLPALAKLAGGHAVLRSRVLRFFGIGESALVTQIADLIDGQTNPTVAPYIKDFEVTVRVTAKAASDAEADALIAPIAQELLARLAPYYYGDGDDNSLAQTVVRGLANRQWQLTAAESLTAGALQGALGDVAGVSEWFKGGFVTYSNATKASMLGLDQVAIDAHGAVSDYTAKAMAQGALRQVGADIAVSLTGVAGPGPNEGQPAGTVWIGVATAQGVTAQEYHFAGTRNSVRGRAVKAGLFAVIQALQK